MIPSFTSGRPNCAFSLAMRRWHASASSHPPPSAKPFTAAITGLRDSSMRRNTCCPSRLTSIPSTGPIVAAGDLVDRLAELADRLLVQRVELVGPVHREHGDSVLDVEQEVAVFGH